MKAFSEGNAHLSVFLGKDYTFRNANKWCYLILFDLRRIVFLYVSYIDIFGIVYVVVQFFPWFKFYFPLFSGMVMCDNEFETKENKFGPRIKLNYNIYLLEEIMG